jgi:hypothetical protein
MLNPRTATAKDFDAAAHRHANGFWFWLIISGAVGYLWGWWASFSAAICLLKAAQSISSTKQAANLRKGTYRIPNPNNGIPD